MQRQTAAAALTASIVAGSIALAGAGLAQGIATVATGDILSNAGETAVLTVQAAGVQIYECRAGADGKLAWAFREPRAELTVAGKTVGRHYAGPIWEHGDGSIIKGAPKARAEAPEAGAIPWLKLAGIEGKGTGVLEGVTTILRTNTKGGALAGACDAPGRTQEQPYTSDYVFLKKGG